MAKILELFADNEDKLCLVGSALSSPTRIHILKLLYYNSFSVKEIAEKLGIPASSAAVHIRLLESADLIHTKQQPGTRGSMKLCSRKNDCVSIRLLEDDPNVNQVVTVSMPIGAYTDCSVSPTCGLANEVSLIGSEDRPSDFFRPLRMSAQILWSSSGYVEYKFPSLLEHGISPKEMMLSFEACSEAPNYKEDWKSDLTIWINGVACGTWRSPGDFGARRGRLNPTWWDSGVSQYGKLTILEITSKETRINSLHASDVTLRDLQLDTSLPIVVRLGNQEDAEYIGGFNLFGSKFGDFEQDIIMSFVY